MSWTLKQAPSQAGRTAVVTGANIGLGYETALALAVKGCTVVLACRNPAKAEAAKAAILALHPKARVECQVLDLASLASVRAFAKACRKRHATRRYDKRLAYGQSKLAGLMFACELQRRLAPAGHTTRSVAAHPGVSATNLFQHLPKAVQLFAPLTERILQSACGGAQPTLYAALGDDIQGGDCCGPQSMGEMRGAPGKVGSSRRSRDEAVASRLWAVSEALTGVRDLD